MCLLVCSSLPSPVALRVMRVCGKFRGSAGFAQCSHMRQVIALCTERYCCAVKLEIAIGWRRACCISPPIITSDDSIETMRIQLSDRIIKTSTIVGSWQLLHPDSSHKATRATERCTVDAYMQYSDTPPPHQRVSVGYTSPARRALIHVHISHVWQSPIPQYQEATAVTTYVLNRDVVLVPV